MRWGQGNVGHETWEKLDLSVPVLKMERERWGHGPRKGANLCKLRMTPSDSQQGNREHSPPTSREWIPPTTWISLEWDYQSVQKGRPFSSPWFQPYKTLSKRLSCATLYLDLRSIELRRWMCFKLLILCFFFFFKEVIETQYSIGNGGGFLNRAF